jgi:phage shock protein A
MVTRLTDRIATLLRADAHGVVDSLEERSLLLRQHLRDAELELLQKRAQLEALGEEEERLGEERRRLGERLAALDQDVELALQGEKEDLARFAIQRLLPEQREAAALDVQIAEVAKARSRLASKLESQERAMEELRGRARSRLQRGPSCQDDLLGAASVADEEVELELLRRRGEREGAR